MRKALALGGMAATYFCVRTAVGARRTTYHPVVAEETDCIVWNAALMAGVNDLAPLLTEEELRAVLAAVRAVRGACADTSRASLWRVQEATAQLERTLTRVVNRARPGASADALRDQMRLAQDVLPTCLEIVEGVQHNHMMDAVLV